MPEGLLQEAWKTETLQAVQTMFQMEEEEERKFERKERQEREQKQESRIAGLRQQYQVQIPSQSVWEEFAEKSKESVGARKRSIRSKMHGSRLRAKRKQAERVEAAKEVWKEILRRRKQELEAPEGCSTEDFQALMQYLTEDEKSNRLLLPGQMEESHLSEEQCAHLVRQYMELDLNVDLRTDQTVAAESLRLEEISGKTKAMFYLLNSHPELREQLPREEREDLQAKLELGKQIADYYELQKKVMTNVWYRNHYNSEISHRYQEGDTLEQKNLTLLLWQAEYLRSEEGMASDRSRIRRLMLYEENVNQENEAFTQNTRAILSREITVAEYGKNVTNIEDSPHAAYFRQHDVAGDPLRVRLKEEHYQVTGEQAAMGESFVRHLSNLPRWKAVQHMEAGEMQQMIENLIRSPEQMNDPEEIERCRQANLQGMRVFKEQIKKQMNYLKRKYGNGFPLLSAQELMDHLGEFENDFTNMQGLSEFVIYLKKLPGMFDESDPKDQEMDQWLDYYQSTLLVEAGARSLFNQGEHKTYSDYKRGVALQIIKTPVPRSHIVETSDQLHLDVRWGTAFDQNNMKLDELIKLMGPESASWFLDELREIYPQEELSKLTWNKLASETRNMSSDQATEHFINKEVVITDQMRHDWKEGGLDFGNASYFGVGTDDFPKINTVYREILDHPETWAEHGLTSEELVGEFRDHLARNGECKVFMATEDCYMEKILVMKAQAENLLGSAEGVMQTYLRQMVSSLQKKYSKHEKRKHDYTEQEMNPRFYDFAKFRERIGMWLVPEHQKVMREKVEPAIAEKHPDMEITVSGITLPVHAGVMTELLEDKKLKEGVKREEYERLIGICNQEFARATVMMSMINAFDSDAITPEAKEPLWTGVRRRVFFQFELANRHASCVDRIRELYQRLDEMTEIDREARAARRAGRTKKEN